jgi:hypothetical protein
VVCPRGMYALVEAMHALFSRLGGWTPTGRRGSGRSPSLVDGDGSFLPHLLSIDPTLHWANPAAGVGGPPNGWRRSHRRSSHPKRGPAPWRQHRQASYGQRSTRTWIDIGPECQSARRSASPTPAGASRNVDRRLRSPGARRVKTSTYVHSCNVAVYLICADLLEPRWPCETNVSNGERTCRACRSVF